MLSKRNIRLNECNFYAVNSHKSWRIYNIGTHNHDHKILLEILKYNGYFTYEFIQFVISPFIARHNLLIYENKNIMVLAIYRKTTMFILFTYVKHGSAVTVLIY